MAKMKGISIITKMAITILISIVIIVSAIVGYYAYSMGKRLTALQEQRNRFYTVSQASKALDAMLTDDIRVLEKIVKDIKATGEDVEYSFFRLEDGTVIADTFGGKMPDSLKGVGVKVAEEVKDTRLSAMTIRNFSYPIAIYGTINIGFKKLTLLGAIREDIGRILLIYLLALSFGLVLSLFISTRIVGRLKGMMEGIRAIGEGRVDVSIEVTSSDEIGQIALAFNETLERLRGYIQTEEERKQAQKNLIAFLDILSEASDGDFSGKAPVTADVFGSLADAYNLMIDGLNELLFDVKNSADLVGNNSRQMLEIFDRMSQGSEVQMVEVKKASESVDETSGATVNISDSAGNAQQIAIKAGQAARKGGKLVIQTIEGMQLVRVTVQTINKRMKSLSEKLLEIGNISQLISEISSRTNMLAMNASIEAARAGDQGRGFVVIAEEIRALADKSAGATKDITGIIKAIQTEAGEVTASLEEETKHVEMQTRISTDTGLAFRDIDSAIKESNKVVSDIFNLSQSQSDLTQSVVLAMEEVDKISLQMLKFVDDSKKITDNLSTTSMSLLNSVSRFKLADEVSKEIEAA